MVDYKALRIIFMGTPEFAVTSLQALLQADCNVVAVVSAPDKPGGRGMQLQQSAVKSFAIANRLPVLQPEKLKDENFLAELRSFAADLQVVVAFRMLPEVVWNMPVMGSINLHGSLLPQYRGAAPIHRAVMKGEKVTGVTTFLLQQEIDTGNILLQETMPIHRSDTTGDVHDRMMQLGADVLVKTIIALAAKNIEAKPQENIIPENELNHAPKLHTADCEIDWTKTTEENYNFIRGLSPFPAAFTKLNDKKLKIFFAEISEENHPGVAGEMVTDQKTFLGFKCKDGLILVKRLQLEGKKKMEIEDFLRGYKFE